MCHVSAFCVTYQSRTSPRLPLTGSGVIFSRIVAPFCRDWALLLPLRPARARSYRPRSRAARRPRRGASTEGHSPRQRSSDEIGLEYWKRFQTALSRRILARCPGRRRSARGIMSLAGCASRRMWVKRPGAQRQGATCKWFCGEPWIIYSSRSQIPAHRIENVQT